MNFKSIIAITILLSSPYCAASEELQFSFDDEEFNRPPLIQVDDKIPTFDDTKDITLPTHKTTHAGKTSQDKDSTTSPKKEILTITPPKGFQKYNE